MSFIYFVSLEFNILVSLLSKCRFADEPSTLRYIKLRQHCMINISVCYVTVTFVIWNGFLLLYFLLRSYLIIVSCVHVFLKFCFFCHIFCCRYADEPSIMRYIKIAATLRDKTVRDVALRCRWMTVSSLPFTLEV